MKTKLALTMVALLLPALTSSRAQNIFVTNFGSNSITEYDKDGTGTPFTSAFVNGPNGIALDAAGNVYVTTNENTVEKFSASGSDLGVFASVGLNFPLGLAFDRSGNLYVANFSGNTVREFAPDGSDLGVFAIVLQPTGLTFDTAGNLYVAHDGNSIARFTPAGAPLTSFTSAALLNPKGLAFDSLGNLFVASNATDSIRIFSPNGSDLGTLGSIGLSGPVGLAFDRADNLYVVNSLTATIEKFSTDGGESIFATTGFQPAFIAVQTSPTLVNISTRLNVLTGDNILDGGFIITGAGTKTVLIRGLGPSLGAFGIADPLADPLIELHSGTTNDIIASNDNWKNNQKSEIEATGIAPTNDAEAALIATLNVGAYTVIERGKQSTTGVGLIEIYDLGGSSGADLANISTRGFVDLGSNVMIAGFIAASSTGGSGDFVIRGLGPSLGAFGIADPLADPVLELHDSNGTLIASNDNWKSDQQLALEATGLAPANDAEAAILATLAPGPYTAIESGANGGIGVGLVEVYNLP